MPRGLGSISRKPKKQPSVSPNPFSLCTLAVSTPTLSMSRSAASFFCWSSISCMASFSFSWSTWHAVLRNFSRPFSNLKNYSLNNIQTDMHRKRRTDRWNRWKNGHWTMDTQTDRLGRFRYVMNCRKWLWWWWWWDKGLQEGTSIFAALCGTKYSCQM